MTSTMDKNSRHSARRLVGFARAVAFVMLAAATAAPAAAQIGGLRKKLKAASGAPETADKGTRTGAPAEGGGTLVLDDEVLDRFMAGLRAGKAERDAAAKEDTPYGRYVRAAAAYAAAKPKCDAAAQTWPQRLSLSEPLMEKNNALLEKMVAAMQKQDTAGQRVYADSLAALQDPSCAVKEPAKTSEYFGQQREVDGRAEQMEMKVSGFDRRELYGIKDRVIAALENAPLPDMSPSEQAAVNKRADELNRLMDREQARPPAVTKAAQPAPVAPPPSQPVASGMSPGQEATMKCMAGNSQKHEKEIERLGERVQAAAEGGNTQAAMAIADSIRQLQMAGCPGS